MASSSTSQPPPGTTGSSVPTVTSPPATGSQASTPTGLATEMSSSSNSLIANGAGSVQPSVSSSFTLQSASPNTANDSGSTSKINRTALIGIIVGGSAFILIIFLFALFYILRRRKRRRALPDKLPPSTGDEESKPPVHQEPSKPVSFEQPRKRSIGEGPVYEAVNHEAQDSPNQPNPAFLHEKDKELSSEATTPNMRHSITLENDTTEDVKDNTPLDPFSSGYIPPPSPTPSEYVIVEHTTDQPQPPQTSRDKRESRSSLLDTIVPEEGRDFSTLGSVLSGRQSTIGHRRTRSGEPSGSTTSTTPPPKRLSNRLHKPRPSLETSSSFLRPTSPFKLHRSLSPIQFPKDPFEASVEEEGVGPLRSSMDRTQQSSLSHETHEVDGLPGHKPVSARPSMDGVGGAAGAGEKGMGSRKRSHIRTPSSPTFFSMNRRVASTSVLSLHKDQQQQQQQDSTQPYLHSQADASVYDFDIYRQPDDPALQPPLPISTLTPTSSHPPPASAARLSAALSAAAADVYGAGGASAAAKKRFSASMSDLPALHSGTTIPNSVRFPASASSNQVNMFGKEGNDDNNNNNSRNGLAPTTNLYIPKESLDLPP